ncbi:type IV pilus assembly protein PilM [Motilibacter aurantiacus]|uniref:type IV pilus assembly protein PilM n=1 Tax=Motilibacter aurantiacus TaxID=2714955 RepID=UPI0014096C41|nr:type IV pilus assembly protein PilM [Motilibacter aurantiacus]
MAGAIGLDIGTSGVRAAEVSSGKGRATLERLAEVPLPPGAVRDGEVVDVAAVAAALRELWATGRFSTKKVALGVANSRVVVRQVELPWMPLADLKASLAFQAQDLVPMPIDQALLDFHPLEEFEAPTGARLLRGLLVAASREMVDKLVDAVQQAKLVPTSVDLTSFAVLRSIGSVVIAGPAADGPGVPVEAIVDVGACVTNVLVHQGGVPRFVRILPMGGQHLTEAVADRLGVPFERAEQLKQELGAGAPDGPAPEWDGSESDHARRALADATSALVAEIRGSFDYYVASSGTAPIAHLLLSGGSARLAGLDARLSEATRLPVRTVTPLPRLRIGRTGLSEHALGLLAPSSTVPVGLALGAA